MNRRYKVPLLALLTIAVAFIIAGVISQSVLGDWKCIIPGVTCGGSR